MCRLTPAPSTTKEASSYARTQPTQPKFFSIWPLPVWLVVGIVPFLPLSDLLLNWGYTKWCHWLFLGYCLTHSNTLCQFICIQSLLINVGWYCTLATDYYYDGRVGDILFRNMPDSIAQHMFLENVSGQDAALITTTVESYQAHPLAFGLDFLLHPCLCYYVWSQCWKRQMSLADIASWPMLGAAVVLSRIWSLVHCHHHYQTTDMYYYGPHVYKVPFVYNHLWTAAYVGETVTVALLVSYKVLLLFRQKPSFKQE